jgi:hypothetical protein
MLISPENGLLPAKEIFRDDHQSAAAKCAIKIAVPSPVAASPQMGILTGDIGSRIDRA